MRVRAQSPATIAPNTQLSAACNWNCTPVGINNKFWPRVRCCRGSSLGMASKWNFPAFHIAGGQVFKDKQGSHWIEIEKWSSYPRDASCWIDSHTVPGKIRVSCVTGVRVGMFILDSVSMTLHPFGCELRFLPFASFLASVKKPRPTSYRGARANCIVMGGVMRPTRSTDPSIELLSGVGVE